MELHYRKAVHHRAEDAVWECSCGRWWAVRPSNIRSTGAKARDHMRDAAPDGAGTWRREDLQRAPVTRHIPGTRANVKVLRDLI